MQRVHTTTNHGGTQVESIYHYKPWRNLGRQYIPLQTMEELMQRVHTTTNHGGTYVESTYHYKPWRNLGREYIPLQTMEKLMQRVHTTTNHGGTYVESIYHYKPWRNLGRQYITKNLTFDSILYNCRTLFENIQIIFHSIDIQFIIKYQSVLSILNITLA